MVNEFLMNAYPDQRSHSDLIFFDWFIGFSRKRLQILCTVIHVSVNCDLRNEFGVKHYLTSLIDVIMNGDNNE